MYTSHGFLPATTGKQRCDNCRTWSRATFSDRLWWNDRIRHNCVLNKGLFRYNIINSPLCTCGKIGDAYQFFFSCNKYSTSRNDLFNAIFEMDNLHIVDTRVLLWGDNSISIKDTEKVFYHVQLFIKRSGRFWFIVVF
jgi:hypothetical protein